MYIVFNYLYTNYSKYIWPKEKTTVYIYHGMCTDQSRASKNLSDFRPFSSFSQSLITKFVSSTLPSPNTSTHQAKFNSGTSVTLHIRVDMSSHQGHSKHSGPGWSGGSRRICVSSHWYIFCFVLFSVSLLMVFFRRNLANFYTQPPPLAWKRTRHCLFGSGAHLTCTIGTTTKLWCSRSIFFYTSLFFNTN